MFDPGVKVVMWVERTLPPRALGIFMIVALTQVAASGVALSCSSDSTGVVIWAYIAIAVQAVAAYLSEAKTVVAERTRKTAAEQANDRLKRHKRDAMGNLAELLRSALDKEGFQRLPSLRQAFLRHAVDVVRETLAVGATDQTIAASWVRPNDALTSFQTVAYDRNHPTRQTGNEHPIGDDIPGASTAFKTHCVAFVDDTHSFENQAYFRRDAPYRSVVSIPVALQNVSGARRRTLAVLNLDCTERGILDPSLAAYVHDVAYVIALCEHLLEPRDERRPKEALGSRRK